MFVFCSHKKLCEQNIIHQTTFIDISPQNEVAKRDNRHLIKASPIDTF